MVPPYAWLSKRKRVEGAASSFAAELAREIVHGRSFRALAFANHMEMGAKFSGKWEGSSAWLMVTRRRTDARKHHGATVICVAEFAARIVAFWLVGAHEKHVERLG